MSSVLSQRAIFFFLFTTIAIFICAPARPLRAQEGIRVTASPLPLYRYGEAVTFQLSARSSVPITGVRLFFRAPRGSQTAVGEASFIPGPEVTARYSLDLTAHPLPPFIPVEFWWEIRDNGGSQLTTPPQIFNYEDNRFNWQTLTRDSISVHWYRGDSAFGQAALDIAVAALPQANRDIQAPLPESVNVYIYADEVDVQAALQLVGRAWAGGHADPALGVAMVSVAPDLEADINLGREIPHELTHLLIYTATGAAYARVPNWLNEGLAVMNQAQPNPDSTAVLTAAREAGDLLSLGRLCGPFPTDPAQAQLAYAESESVVRYIRDRYGDKSLAALLAAYADGAGCEAGVQRALKTSLTDLESNWLKEVVNASPATFSLRRLSPWIVLGALVFVAPAIFVLLIQRAKA